MDISIESNIKQVIKEFDGLLQRDIPYAIQGAINDTLFDMRKEMPKEIERVFDRPVPFTKSVMAWDVEKAKAQQLTAVLKMKPAQAEYMQWQVYGGTELPKKRAIPMPELKSGKLVSKTHGGLQKGWKKVFGDKKKYFSGTPISSKEGSKVLPIAGVYERVVKTRWDKKQKKHTGKIQLVLTWENKAEYDKKWNFNYYATEEFNKRFTVKFRDRIQKAIAYRASKS